jgi:anti-sigma regulatory factor (Ser/Thr protein kinase)
LPARIPSAVSARPGEDLQFVTRVLGPGLASAREARDLTRQVLRSWNLQALFADATLIVSELVTNAERHGGLGTGSGRVEMIWWRRAGQLVCAVTDHSASRPPVLTVPDESAEAGRGLHLVAALASEWGWVRLGASRKAVWAALAIPGTDAGTRPAAGRRDTAVARRAGEAALASLRLDRPDPARMENYLLGGWANLKLDRAAAVRVQAQMPDAGDAGAESHDFMQRAVAWLAGQGVGQFLDAGAAIPVHGGPYEAARAVLPAPKVARVASDPVALAHSRALAARQPGAAAIQGSLRRPAAILADEQLRQLIDFSQPVAVLLTGILHFIGDDEDPAAIAGTFRDAMAPGSYLVISHLTSDGAPAGRLARVRQAYAEAGAPAAFRSREQITQLFDGLELASPGIVRPWQWRPAAARPAGTPGYYAGVARKR